MGEIALAGAEAGEIEAQDGDAVTRQPFGDSAGREDVLRAGEAMGEQRDRRAARHPAVRAVPPAMRPASRGM